MRGRKRPADLPTGTSPPAYHHRQRRQTDLPQPPKVCRDCPCRKECGASANGQKVIYRHIWQDAMDAVEQIRKTDVGKGLCAMRKQTIERVFADAKEKHAMRYTHHRGLARVSHWVTLKFAAMNLKKSPLWHSRHTHPFSFFPLLSLFLFQKEVSCFRLKPPS